ADRRECRDGPRDRRECPPDSRVRSRPSPREEKDRRRTRPARPRRLPPRRLVPTPDRPDDPSGGSGGPGFAPFGPKGEVSPGSRPAPGLAPDRWCRPVSDWVTPSPRPAIWVTGGTPGG